MEESAATAWAKSFGLQRLREGAIASRGKHAAHGAVPAARKVLERVLRLLPRRPGRAQGHGRHLVGRIFNLSTRHKPLSVLTCAFLRHAVRWWYAALTDIKENGKGTFVREHVMCTTLERFQDAVVRYARSIRQHYVQRRFTNLEGHVAEKTRKKFEAVVQIELDGKYTF